jgi:hypothetical protein
MKIRPLFVIFCAVLVLTVLIGIAGAGSLVIVYLISLAVP